MIKTITISKLNDPGHGWHSVNLRDLAKLNIKISSMYNQVISNKNRTRIYLEEDSEYQKLFNYLKSINVKIKIKNFYTNKQSKVRKFDVCIFNDNSNL